MKCLNCGVEFHPSDIEVMNEGEEPICDDCVCEELNRKSNIQ